MNLDSFIDDLAESATPVSPLNIRQFSLALLLGLACYLSVIVALFGVRDDWLNEITTMAYQGEMALSLLIVFGAGLSVIKLAVPRQGSLPTSWCFLLLALTLGAVIGLLGNVSIQALEASLKSNHFYITFGLIAYAAPVAGALLWFLRQKGSPTQLGWAGLMALLSASASGHFLMRTIGQSNNFAEVFIWCYLPVLALALLGMLIGKKLLRW